MIMHPPQILFRGGFVLIENEFPCIIKSKEYQGVKTMKKYVLTEQIISKFRKYLVLQEKSDATTEKYCRDVEAFASFAGSSFISKDTALAYKNKLKNDGYAARSINSMIASINSLSVTIPANG